jgi:cytochrome b involved in lipid metabolism
MMCGKTNANSSFYIISHQENAMGLENKFNILLGIIAIIFVGYLAYSYQVAIQGTPRQNSTSLQPGSSLSLSEIAKHNSSSDCWMIVNGKVYNATGYESLHPGGAQRIINYCGKDATAAFDGIKSGTGHSPEADLIHAGLYIGNIGGQVQNSTQSQGPGSIANNIGTNQPADGQNIILTLSEVAKHSTAADCWMIVNGKVYAVTNYESMHPGGAQRIISFCGKDATAAFDSIKGGTGHDAAADVAHAALFIGDLNSQVSSSTAANAGMNITTIPGGRQREYEND